MQNYLQVFINRRVAAVAALGFSSGLPLLLTASTLQAWMTTAGVNLRTIGLFSLVGLPYSVKFLWSPLIDAVAIPWMGRRRGWIALMQLMLAGAVAWMAFTMPSAVLVMALAAMCVALLSATQDIAIDAYRADVLRENERGAGAAASVAGYRIAMLVSGALALVMSQSYGWRNVYLVMAGLMALCAAATAASPEPEVKVRPPSTFGEAVVRPLGEYFSRPGCIGMLLLILFYKLGDAYAGSLTTAFLIRGVGFSAAEVGTVNKGMGLVATIIGAAFGGGLMARIGLFRSLFWFGVLQMVSNLCFAALALTGRHYGMFMTTIAFENLSGGMGTAALVALLIAMCDKRFSATQYALLSSLAAAGRILIAPSAGYVAESLGWPVFFLITTVAAVPGLVCVLVYAPLIKGGSFWRTTRVSA